MSVCSFPHCNSEFIPKVAWQIYCSTACKQADAAELYPERKSAANQRQYAKRSASEKAKRESARLARPIRQCEHCGKDLPAGSHARKRFCNRDCINANSLKMHYQKRLENNHRYRQRRYSDRSLAVLDRDWQRLVHRYGGCCAYCGVKSRLTMDHVVPLSRGGRHSIGNVLPACSRCNGSKGARTLTEWRKSLRKRETQKGLTALD